MLALAATLPLLLALPAGADEAVAAALQPPGTRAELLSLAPAGRGCTAERWEALGPVAGSGTVPLRFSGRSAAGEPCSGAAWARVRVTGPVLVTTRPVPAGAPLAGAAAPAERELRPGRHPLAALPPAAVAERPLPAGAVLTEDDLRLGPQPGDPVVVVIQLGALAVEQPGRAIPCARGRACAQLPSGKRVEGSFEAGRLLVEAP